MMTAREAIEYFEAIFETEALGKNDIEAMNIAISALREREERSMSWINVKERLPEDHEEVLVYIPGESCIDIAVHRTLLKGYAYWSCSDDAYDNDEVTHWMPVPEPPKEEA